MKFKFSKRSLNNLQCVDSRLVVLVTTYLNLDKYDIAVTYGARTSEEQKEFYDRGLSEVTYSSHQLRESILRTQLNNKVIVNKCYAVDILVYKADGQPTWNKEDYEPVIRDMKRIVKQYGWENEIGFGFDYKSLSDPFHIYVKSVFE